MTPNILEGMKCPFKVVDYVWFDIQDFDGAQAERDVEEAANKLGLPELLHNDYPPKDMPMPFEKIAIVRRTKAGLVLVVTYERTDNVMLVTLRTAKGPYLAWFRHHGDIVPPAPNLEFDMDEVLGPKMMKSILNDPDVKARGLKDEDSVIQDFITGVRHVYLAMLIMLMERKHRVTAYTPIPNPTNEKRIRKGKRPIFEWKVIDVTAAQAQPEGHAPTGKTHASPRRHVRRGHQRRYKNGKVVWIREMMVGKIEFGYIHHSYTSNLTKGEQ